MAFLISGSDMLTALLPIRVEQNPFWSSSQGLKCIENFLKALKQISDIDNYFIVTEDAPVCKLAEKHSMEIEIIDIPGNINQPYSFEQTSNIANTFTKKHKDKTDSFIIVDHRNLLFSADDITRANSLFQLNPEAGVIGLSFCRDYPCQYKSYSNFLNCVIVSLKKHDAKNDFPDNSQHVLTREINCDLKEYGTLAIQISGKSPQYNISFGVKKLNFHGYVAQIIPFTSNGPQYEQCQEIYVPTPEFEKLFKTNTKKTTGFIITLTTPSQSSEYDTIEIFTNPNAPWELSAPGATTVADKTRHKAMFGRQQFPTTYTYDGSLCILKKNHLARTHPNTLIMKPTYIVTDWVDYWYTVASQQTDYM